MPDFKPGQTVQLSDGRRAIVRFAGQTHFQVGDWVGVELEEKTGKNDGSVQGERYFDCPTGYGMFVKPMLVTILAQPTEARAAPPRRPARPSSFNPAALRGTVVGDAAAAKRQSLNAPSPSPRPASSRPSSFVRSPAKSPIKQLSGPPSSSASRTNTSLSSRVPSAGPQARTTVGGTRSAMGPPAAPAYRTLRQSSFSSAARSGPQTRPVSVRASTVGARTLSQSAMMRRPSVEPAISLPSQPADEAELDPVESQDAEVLSPQQTKTTADRTQTLEKAAAVASAGPREAAKPRTMTEPSVRQAGSVATNREVEDLKVKLKVLERKRLEDQDKLVQLEKVQGERDKYENIIQKLQQKYQPLQQENNELKKQLKEAETRFESVETMQAEHDYALELLALDREMAEESAEVLKMEVDTLRQKSEELELEVEILREENAEFSKGLTAEERASTGWLQMERTNERLRETLLRLRDMTQAQEEELRDQIRGLEEESKELAVVREKHEQTTEKLAKSEAVVDDLRQQLDTALGAEDMIEDLTERNMSMSERIDELKAVIADMENLKEVSEELEANHVQIEREMQEDLDFKDSVIAEQARRAEQQEETLEDMEYTVSRFRELVSSLQNDLEDMRASQAVTEGESEKLNDRSRAMMDLNMKLQLSAAKAQAKTIDLELRRLDAQQAEQQLEIVKRFLPESYQSDQGSVLVLQRFRRISFKARLLYDFVRERFVGQVHPSHEDEVVAGCDAVDNFIWLGAICDRLVDDVSHCSIEHFSKYQNALPELEPVERALNGWIDGLRRDELKIKKCAEELHRIIAVVAHLADVHLSGGLANFAGESHMRVLMTQTRLDSAALVLGAVRGMAQRAMASVSEEGDDAEPSRHLIARFDQAVTQVRSSKVVAGKAMRALNDLKIRSLSLAFDTRELFEQCETKGAELAAAARQIATALHRLLTEDEGRTEPFACSEILSSLSQAASQEVSAAAPDPVSAFSAKLGDMHGLLSDLVTLTADLNGTEEFDVLPPPWQIRSQEMKAVRTVPVDVEEELQRIKEEHHEARRLLAQRDENLSIASLKVETLEARMRDAQANVDRVSQLQRELDASAAQVASCKEDIEKQDRELKELESERDQWKKMASDSRAFADDADAADMKAGHERAVATARQMDVLKQEVDSLQSAVRYLREDNRRARTVEQSRFDWLAEPLTKPASVEHQRRKLLAAEGKDVLGELLRMSTSATVLDLSTLPQDKLAWRPAKSTPQYHAAKQMEDYAAWKGWRDAVVRKAAVVRRTKADGRARLLRDPAAQLHIRLPGADGKMVSGGKRQAGREGVVSIVGSRAWEALQPVG